ncbi:hypothetical protein HanPSC8_Chr07g0292721 [Helianthus annuus]|nr:hypothetical protein HanPSC8_Chr07g0292721 [Helianthus annuus]
MANVSKPQLPVCRNLRNTIEGSPDANHAIRRVASLPVLLCHGVGERNKGDGHTFLEN